MVYFHKDKDRLFIFAWNLTISILWVSSAVFKNRKLFCSTLCSKIIDCKYCKHENLMPWFDKWQYVSCDSKSTSMHAIEFEKEHLGLGYCM